MNWLEKLDDFATKFLPEEDLQDNSRRDNNDDIMISDPHVDGFVHYDDKGKKMKADQQEDNHDVSAEATQFRKSLVIKKTKTKTEPQAFCSLNIPLDDNPNKAKDAPIALDTHMQDREDTHSDKTNKDANELRLQQNQFASNENQPTGDVTAELDPRLSHVSERNFNANSQNDHRAIRLDGIDTGLDKETRAFPKRKKSPELPEMLGRVNEKLPYPEPISDEDSSKFTKLDKSKDQLLSAVVPRVASNCSLASDPAQKSLPDPTCTNTVSPPQKIDIFDEKLSIPDALNFNLPGPVESWNTFSEPLNPGLNCMGVVHVRFLAAQRLLCPLGSTIQPVTSLKPWKGKVRGECTETFGNLDNGVCAKWDALNEASVCSMVHAWNSEDTPIPVINIELIFKPLPLLDFSMCTLDLSCRPLMQQPGVWKKQWCEASISKSDQITQAHSGKDKNPLILLEAAFFPASDDNDDEDQDIDVKSATSKLGDASTMASSHILRTRNKLHLFKIQSLWVPAHCGLCKRSLVGYRRVFRCEACKIDCCKDCQVQIDLQIPCGSELARSVVDKSIQNTITMDNLLTTIAPPDKTYINKMQVDAKHESNEKIDSKIRPHDETKDFVKEKTLDRSVGVVHIKIDQACILTSPLPLETNPDIFERFDELQLSQGDYYVRVSCVESMEENRTTTIQCSGKPKFSSPEMLFNVPNYGSTYRIELFDADSNHCVGTTLLTTQTLLQVQRDSLIERSTMPLIMPYSINSPESYQKCFKMELRTGIKRGFESTYSLPKKESKSNPSKGKKLVQAGSISGWIKFEARIEQRMSDLYGQNAIVCPARTPNKLDLELVQLHISRLISCFGAIQDAIKWYSWLISWDNPLITLFSLLIFVGLCKKFNMEYIGCLPIVVAIVAMISNFIGRKSGSLKHRFIKRQRETCIKEVLELSVDRSVHRPIGAVNICIKKGRSLRSQELGITSSVGCDVFWDPLRFCIDVDEEKKLISEDKLLGARHDVGQTEFLFSVNPEWKHMKKSNALLRMQRLSPNLEASLSGRKEKLFGKKQIRAKNSLLFPILQPIQRIKQSDKQNSSSLLPWSRVLGALVVQVKFGDVLNKLPGFEDTIGEVVIPLSELVLRNEIKGWFQVIKVNSTRLVNCDEDKDSGSPCVYLHLRWIPPDLDIGYSESFREESLVLEEDMIRAASSRALAQRDIIGNSLEALNTMRGIGGTLQSIQNTLGDIVDMLEITRNILNFADPRFSFLILSALCIFVFVLATIRTRTFVMLIGLAQYFLALITKFQNLLSSRKVRIASDEASKAGKNEGQRNGPISTWVTNVIRSMPTDEDLRKSYFWEGMRIGEEACSEIRKEKRIALLTKLWKASWFSVVSLRVEGQSGIKDGWSWQDGYFAVVFGRQLLIWTSEIEFDEGEIPCNQLSLSGHAGLAGLSPVELRVLSEDEILRVVNIFGRGENSQLKLMLLLPDKTLKDELELAITETMIKDH